jgi:hypothetical protein
MSGDVPEALLRTLLNFDILEISEQYLRSWICRALDRWLIMYYYNTLLQL